VKPYNEEAPDLTAVVGWGASGTAEVLWAVGYAGTILKSTDGGSSWTNAAAGLNLPEIDLYDVDVVSKVRACDGLHKLVLLLKQQLPFSVCQHFLHALGRPCTCEHMSSRYKMQHVVVTP
jgi:hypothetical protein